MSYAIHSKKFTCSSSNLTQCFQDLFDFICRSLSALNSYFDLFKTTRVHKCRSWSGFFSDVADYELFRVHNPLSDEKSKLNISYVNKTFQWKPKHFCSLHVYITNEIWALLVQMDSVALPITHVCLMQIW